MFQRKILKQLCEWKKSPSRKPLIIRGARQVGKTSTIQLFGAENFQETLHINLEKQDILRSFQNVASLNEFEQLVEITFGEKIIPGKTLLFIDEIQNSPALLGLLRFFYAGLQGPPHLHDVILRD